MGVLLPNSAEVAEKLEQAAYALAQKLGVDCLETRNRAELQG